MINPDLVREIIDYDPSTGVFTWKVRDQKYFATSNQFLNWNGRYPGTVAGRVDSKGYRSVALFDKLYRANRLAWLYVHGFWPVDLIDHINGDRDDNRISNLRDVTASGNARNQCFEGHSSSGRVGVNRYTFMKKPCWVARIRANGRLRHLGYFENLEDAILARENAEREHGYSTWPATKTPLRSRGFAKTRGNAR